MAPSHRLHGLALGLSLVDCARRGCRGCRAEWLHTAGLSSGTDQRNRAIRCRGPLRRHRMGGVAGQRFPRGQVGRRRPDVRTDAHRQPLRQRRRRRRHRRGWSNPVHAADLDLSSWDSPRVPDVARAPARAPADAPVLHRRPRRSLDDERDRRHQPFGHRPSVAGRLPESADRRPGQGLHQLPRLHGEPDQRRGLVGWRPDIWSVRRRVCRGPECAGRNVLQFDPQQHRGGSTNRRGLRPVDHRRSRSERAGMRHQPEPELP